ncbi:MAG: ATP-grasp domain-containing protein, partial [Xanthobacteraceae bacterium]|nr:ATP-grasp domain-containing protein [Xanthobacteraceae bacterium]
MPKRAVLIAAASGRALAASGRRAGYAPLVIDYFADQDTIASAQAYVRLASGLDRGMHAPEVIAALQTLSEQEDPCGVVWGSGFEDRPGLLGDIARGWKLIGNGPDVVEHVKHPMLLAKLCRSCNIPYPDTQMDPPEDPRGWLIKRIGGSGGTHIRDAAEAVTSPRLRGEVDARSAAGEGASPSTQTRGDAPSPGLLRNPTSPRKRGEVKPALASFYYQRRVAGEPISALVVADGKAALILGFSTQWSSPSPAHLFRYGGALRPAPLAPDIAEALRQTVQRLTSLTGLVGLNSFDFLIDGGTFHLLEINPRPGATIDIFEPAATPSLFALHVDACAGRLPDRTPALDGAAASAIVYAPADI